jgi:plasmid maintenance system antidote protein VapI
MHNPPHPGETLREVALPAVGLALKKVKPIAAPRSATMKRLAAGARA